MNAIKCTCAKQILADICGCPCLKLDSKSSINKFVKTNNYHKRPK